MNDRVPPTAIDVGELAAAPERMLELTSTAAFSLPVEAIADYQITALQKRFRDLVPRVPVLARLADEQGIGAIRRTEDAAPLLFKHSVYKSYPLSFLDSSSFGRLTQWLKGLTSLDLSGVDAAGCETVDDWIQALDSKSELQVIHSGGTSGKLSFLPRSRREMPSMVHGWKRYFERFGAKARDDIEGIDQVPLVYVGQRRGAMAHHRLMDAMLRYLYAGDESKIVTLHPGRMSADMLSVGGRLKTAEAKGELGRLQLPPHLLARREAFLAEQRGAAERVRDFIFDLAARMRGARIAMMSHQGQIYDFAVAGLARGIEKAFAADSFIMMGGGSKGRVFPPDWQDTVRRFFQVEDLRMGYGMTECMNATRECSKGKFHFLPYVIPYLLDPRSGEPAPRTGTHTGRFGLIDLAAQTYWGGILTGDEVTLTFGDRPCGCGRAGPHLDASIRRYGEQEGGDDKITCAGAPEAHDRAVDRLLQDLQ